MTALRLSWRMTACTPVLGWAPEQPLRTGLEHTYRWIAGLVDQNARDR